MSIITYAPIQDQAPAQNERLTVPTLPARVVPDLCGDDPAWRVESKIEGCASHSIDYDDASKAWVVWPADTQPLSVGDARTYVHELRIALSAADTLNRHKPRVIPASEVAVTQEVEAIIAEREWSRKDAAAAFDMSEAQLTSRLRGHSFWTLLDVLRVADGVTDDREDRRELLLRLATASQAAGSPESPATSPTAAGAPRSTHSGDMWAEEDEPRALRRPVGLDEQLRSRDV